MDWKIEKNNDQIDPKPLWEGLIDCLYKISLEEIKKATDQEMEKYNE